MAVMPSHVVLLAFGLLATLLLFIADRKNIRKYVLLNAIGLVLAYMFETATTYLGFWYYVSEPKIPLVSLYAWLFYVPYLSFCYYIGNRLGGKHE